MLGLEEEARDVFALRGRVDLRAGEAELEWYGGCGSRKLGVRNAVEPEMRMACRSVGLKTTEPRGEPTSRFR